MAKIPDGVGLDQLTVVARRVLLDGLVALDAHRAAITVIGAQAVQLRTVGASIRSAAYTSDGDLGIDPLCLPDEPHLDVALRDAGFEPMDRQPGLWLKRQLVDGVPVRIELDLLVGRGVADDVGRRSARLPPHGPTSARWVDGIELACVDRSPMPVAALEPGDDREVGVHVAGPVALLVAKAFKINDRLAQATASPHRLVNKDAGDVIRLMMTTPPTVVGATLRELRADDRVGEVAVTGERLLRELFGGPRAAAVDMAVEALRGDVPEQRVRALAPAFLRGAFSPGG